MKTPRQLSTALGTFQARWITSVLLAVAAAFPPRLHGFGSGDKGTAAAQFLKIGPGARASGMAEAFSGVADDAYAAYYNPGGLGFLKRPEVAATHASHFQGINYEYATVSVPLLSWVDTKRPRHALGVLAVSVTNLGVSNIERRGTTETDAPAETFSASDFAYAASYAYAWPKMGLSAGLTVKYVDSAIGDSHAGAMATDWGLLWRRGSLSLGGGLRHAGDKQRFGLIAERIPTTVFGGASYRWWQERLLGSFDVGFPNDGRARLAWGGEYRHPFTKDLRGSLRAGYASAGKRGTTGGGLTGGHFGGGIGYANFDFDFAWVPRGDIGNSLRYSLHVKF